MSPQQLKEVIQVAHTNVGPVASLGARLVARFIVSQHLVLAGMPNREARRLIAPRVTASNGWTLRCSCCADNLGP